MPSKTRGSWQSATIVRHARHAGRSVDFRPQRCARTSRRAGALPAFICVDHHIICVDHHHASTNVSPHHSLAAHSSPASTSSTNVTPARTSLRRPARNVSELFETVDYSGRAYAGRSSERRCGRGRGGRPCGGFQGFPTDPIHSLASQSSPHALLSSCKLGNACKTASLDPGGPLDARLHSTAAGPHCSSSGASRS